MERQHLAGFCAVKMTALPFSRPDRFTEEQNLSGLSQNPKGLRVPSGFRSRLGAGSSIS